MSLIYALSDLVGVLFSLLTYALIIRVVLSWVQPDPNQPLLRFLLKVTDPVLEPIQRMLPSMGGVVFGVRIAERLVQRVLLSLVG